jgi:hypothetical protein
MMRAQSSSFPSICLSAVFCSAAALCLGCRSPESEPKEKDEPETATPDRLDKGEKLPEAETAFGLPLPRGMRLARHFNDSAYFTGPMNMASALEHVQKHLDSRQVELVNRRSVFARTHILGGDPDRLFRVEISETARGSQVLIKDITPPPVASARSEAEMWQSAGRKPDGTLLDPNSVY